MSRSAPGLAATQELFWRVIVSPRGVEDFLKHASAEDRSLFEQTFSETASFTRVDRLRVYAQAYFWRLFEVLRDQFPITAWLLGSKPFHNLVTDFVLDAPSRSPDIRRFGAAFPRFIGAHSVERHLPGLGELAAVERAIVAAVDLADEARLDIADLKMIAPDQWPQRRFPVTHTAAFVACTLPFAALRRSHEAGQPAGQPPQPADATGPVLVWRQANHEVYQRRLCVAEGRALQALSQGGTFADACDAAAGPAGDAATAADVVTWLQRWLQDDLLVRSPETG